MAKGRIAAITADTVGRTRIIGRDENGLNIEEKICPIVGEVFLDLDGNLAHHPLENGRIPSPAGQKAGRDLREEGIKKHGWLPVGECPYTERYFHLVKGPLVKPPAGQKDCGGKPDGCEHLHAVRQKRQERARAAAQQRKAARDSGASNAMLATAKAINRWVDSQQSSAPPLEKARGRLRQGKGEDNEGRLQE